MNCYGTLTLLGTPVTSPVSEFGGFEEPITLAECRAFLNLPERSPADEAEDDLIMGLISAARDQAEVCQGRDLVVKRYALSLDRISSTRIELRPDLISVESFAYRDSDGTYASLTEATDYIADTTKRPGVVMPVYGGSWPSFTPWPSGAVVVTFNSGLTPDAPWWSDSGARVKIGMKMLISEWFNNRLPQSYDIAAAGGQSGNGTVDRIYMLMSAGATPKVR